MGLDIKTLAAAKKYAKELAKDAGAIAVDTSMSDISKNPVQNKVIKKYVDDRTITISKKEGNTLSLEDDGLYNPEITDQNKKDIADKILKDMEKGLVAGYIMFRGITSGNAACNTKTAYNVFKILTDQIATNLKEDEYSVKEGWLRLKAGKTYELNCSIALSWVQGATITSRFKNYDTGAIIFNSNPDYNTATNYGLNNINAIYTPEEDVRICVELPANTAYNSNYNIITWASTIVVKELNQYESPIMKQAELGSCFCNLRSDWYTVLNQQIPFVSVSGNMEVVDGKVKIKSKQRVQISVHVSYGTNSSAANIQYAISDITNDINISYFYPYRGQLTDEYGYSQTCQYTNETEDDCWVGVKITHINSADTLKSTYTTMTVQEIGKAIIVENDTSSTVTEISKEENNAIVEKEDGIFVQSHTENITEIQNRIANVKKYQKYVNTELDTAYCTLKNHYTTVANEIVPFFLKNGNMEVMDGKVKVKPGKRVLIAVTINYQGKSNAANILYTLKDFTNSIVIATMQPYRAELNTETGHTYIAQYTNNTDTECDIGVLVSSVYSPDIIIANYSSLNIIEIGHDIVIDAVEHADTTKGIEDTPVGHIISYMGNNPPKHYLRCDGTEYNISDYPYLAEHIKTEFGNYDYFGGNGITTFAVPDLKGEFLRGTGTNGHLYGGHGADVGEHQEPTYSWHGATNLNSGGNILGLYVSNTGEMHVNTDYTFSKQGKYANYAAGGTGSYNATYYTSRPTNTSVLYCIKYEPTYFMKFEGKDRYSTEETIIGEWIDGKPIYRKIIAKDYDITNTAASNDFLFDISSLDAELIIKNYGTVSATGNSGNTSNFPLPYQMQGQQTLASWISITAQKLYIRNCLGTTYPKVILNYLAIEYIKTND